MKVAFAYIRSEWKYWVMAALMFVFMGVLQQSHAAPVLKYTVNGVQFYQDFDANTWYTKYHGKMFDLKETFDDISIKWKGQYKGDQLILIAGQEGRMCEMNFNLYRFKPSGEVRKYTNIPGCYAEKLSVAISGNTLVITLDGKSNRVPL
jgi:hypothetical protein